MSTQPNPAFSQVDGGADAGQRQGGFFSKLGSVIKNIAPYVAPIANRLAATFGNSASLEAEYRDKHLALQQQLQQSEMSNQALHRQLLQKQIAGYETPEQQRAAAIPQAGALEDVKNLHAAPVDQNTPAGVAETGYDAATNKRVTQPKMITEQVPNPALAPYAPGAPKPDFVTDWNNPPPTMPKTVPQTHQMQLAAPPKLDTSVTPYEDARLGVPREQRAQFGSDWQKRQADNKNVNTGEDLKNQIAVAYEKGDKATVARLQAELKAIDPFGADRLADANQRLRDAEAKTADAQRQFHPAIANSVVTATSTQDSVRRLLGILEPYKTDNQPFGNFLKQFEYKYGKAQTDALGQELAGINLSSLQQAASILKSFGGRSQQVLQLALAHTPNPEKDSTMNMYQKMVNIDRSIATFLSDADKYGRKSATDLAPERMAPYGSAPPTMPGVPGAKGITRNPDGSIDWKTTLGIQ